MATPSTITTAELSARLADSSSLLALHLKGLPTYDLTGLPPRLDRRAAARAIEARTGIKVSPRIIERWRLPTTIIAGRAYHPTAAIFAFISNKIAAAERTTASQGG